MFKYIEIGEILKPYKTKGELIAAIKPAFYEDVARAKAIFLLLNGSHVPFFIESVDCQQKTCYIKFEEFGNPEDVKQMNGVKLYLRECDVNWQTKSEKKEIDFSGYMIIDKNSGKRLQILRIEQYPQQIMAVATTETSQYLIPLVYQFILDIDTEAKVITMQLPSGLV